MRPPVYTACLVAIASGFLLASSVGGGPSTASSQVRWYKRETAASGSVFPDPSECHDGWSAGSGSFVVAVEPWADLAGLRRGDRILGFNASKVADAADWVAAFRSVKKSPAFRDDRGPQWQGH